MVQARRDLKDCHRGAGIFCLDFCTLALVRLKSSFDEGGCCTQLSSDYLVAEGMFLCTEDSVGECSVKQPHEASHSSSL